LVLDVRNDGRAKSWLFRWTDRETRKDRVISLGPVKDVDIHEARELALKNRKLLRAGKDPQIERDGVKLEDKIKAAVANKTVKDVYDEFYDAKISHLSEAARHQYRDILGRYVLPRVGNMPIAKVTKSVFLEGVPVMPVGRGTTAVRRDSPENHGKVG